MMLMKRGFTILTILYSLLIVITLSNCSAANDKDPFKSLGIPDLNPKALLEELDVQSNNNKKSSGGKGLPQLKTIDDLPSFLKNSNLNEEEGIKILTRFLIQDDFTLKKYGVVYDQTGFDGITSGERIAPVGTEERLTQRARSAANIWFKSKFTKLDYDAYGAENLMDEIVPNWRIYKVLMIGKNGENTFIKVCLPLDESETALCSDKDEACGPRAEYVEKEKKKNEEYISRIRTNNFFKNKSSLGAVKLLPGEKMVVKEGNKKIVLDSSSLKAKLPGNSGPGGFFNPPSLDSLNGADPLLNAYRMKNNISTGNFMGGFNAAQAQIQQTGINNNVLPNINGFNPNLNGGFGMGVNQGFNLNQNYNSNPIPNQNYNSNPILNQNFNPNSNQNFNPINPANVNPSPVNPNANANYIMGNNFGMQMKPQSSYNFKQKENVSRATPTIDNSQLMNELMQMKNQLGQMMISLKQKDDIINQQNLKISQFNINNGNNGLQNIQNGQNQVYQPYQMQAPQFNNQNGFLA